MMKKFLILFALSFTVTSLLYAQEDRFQDVGQVKGKEVYVIDNSALNIAFTLIDGKVKPVKKNKNVNITMATKTYSVEKDSYTFKKFNYIVLKGTQETILLKEDDAPLFLSSFVSKTYWQERYDSYRNDYTYYDFKKYNKNHSYSATVAYDDLAYIAWKGLEISSKGATFSLCEFNGTQPLKPFKITSEFFEENKDVFFIKKGAIQPFIDKYNARLAKEKRDKEVADSLENCKLRLAIALDKAEFEDDITVYKGDTLAVFSFDKSENKFVARFHYNNLLVKAEDIEFIDTKEHTTTGKYSWEKKTVKTSANSDYLMKKGDEGKKERFVIAAEYDDVQSQIYINKLKTAIDNYNKEVAYKKKNQIFITGIGYAYDSNEYSSRFGMRFDVYNCFTKTIKYIEFTLTNYNAVGDVQRDDVGNASKTVRGIGPIKPEEGGRYTWDDIFWDDRDVISKTRLTNVKFIFTDGTTRVFSGYSNIRKHMTPDAWD